MPNEELMQVLDAVEVPMQTPETAQTPETIEAGPITLVRWTLDHADALDQAINESLPELLRFMPWATVDHDREATVSFLVQSLAQWDEGENFNYAMLNPAGEVVGSCALMSRQGQGVLEIGYWVHSAHAGRGYATIATLAVAEAGLAQPGIDRLEIRHDLDNPASGRVAAKAGFQEVGPVEAEKKAAQDSGTHLVWERRAT